MNAASLAAFASVLGTTQASVSRWEASGRIPGHKQELIRSKAAERGLPWDDRWFFESPTPTEQQETERVGS